MLGGSECERFHREGRERGAVRPVGRGRRTRRACQRATAYRWRPSVAPARPGPRAACTLAIVSVGGAAACCAGSAHREVRPPTLGRSKSSMHRPAKVNVRGTSSRASEPQIDECRGPNHEGARRLRTKFTSSFCGWLFVNLRFARIADETRPVAGPPDPPCVSLSHRWSPAACTLAIVFVQGASACCAGSAHRELRSSHAGSQTKRVR